MNRTLLRPWHAWPVVVLDFETTGPDPLTCCPVELGLVRFEGAAPVARWSSLINPGCPIPPEASAVHGIHDADVATAPSFRDAWAAAMERWLLEDAAPCAYNERFDRPILHRMCDGEWVLHALTPGMPWLDPLVMVRHLDRYVPGKGRHRLTAACARRGIAITTAHRSAGDAEATGRLLFALQPAIGDMTLCELLRRQELRAAEQERDFEAFCAQQKEAPCNPK